MAHGYLGDGYGTHGEIDPDSGNRDQKRSRDYDRERGQRWQNEDRDRNHRWSGNDRESGAFFSGRDEGDERQWRGRDQRWPQDRWPEQRGRADSYNRQSEDWSGQHRHSANPDDHYRNWRDRHMSELDRDYAEYCRECEERFHEDFSNWRQNRSQSSQPSGSANQELELNEVRKAERNQLGAPGAMDAATIGEVNAENEEKGRGGGRVKG